MNNDVYTQPSQTQTISHAGSSDMIGDDLGGVYMRKLAPARVSHRGDFLIPRFHRL